LKICVILSGNHVAVLSKSGDFDDQKLDDVKAPLAQLAEQVTLNHWVAGSIPARCISFTVCRHKTAAH
jgi:hypothetical protein